VGHNVAEVAGKEYVSAGTNGWQVLAIDRETGAVQNLWYQTGGPASSADAAQAIDQLTSELQGLNRVGYANSLVVLISVGDPGCRAYDCQRSLDPLSSRITKLAFDVAPLGGTVSPIFDIMNGKTKSRWSYTLIGGTGIGYGQGDANLRSADGDISVRVNVAPLEGTLARNATDYGYSVQSEEVVGDETPPVAQVVTQPPGPWPGQSDSQDQAAISFIGDHVNMTADPRSEYYTNTAGPKYWEARAAAIEKLSCPSDNPDFRVDNCEWAKTELLKEIHWVPAVKEYFDNLASIYANDKFTSWSKLTAIATTINNSVGGGDDKTTDSALAVVRGVVDLAEEAPVAGKVVSIVNGVYSTALELAQVNDGEPATENFQVKASEVGENFSKRMDQAQDAIETTMYAETVADYHKLETVGSCYLKESSCPQDPAIWEIGSNEKTHALQSLQVALSRNFYGVLLRAKYTAYNTPSSVKYDNPGQLTCFNLYNYAFKDIPSSDWMRRPNSYGSSELWILAQPEYAPTPSRPNPKIFYPATDVTNKLFEPLDQRDITAGGLGLNREQFFAQYFEPPSSTDELGCHFPTHE
jgi:hypothetical protein